MHFLRSLYADSLLQNGYEVRRMVRIANTEKERVRAIYSKMHIGAGSPNVVKPLGSNGIIRVGPTTPSNDTTSNADSVKYYQSVMRQKNYKDVYGESFLSADSLIAKQDGVYKLLYFTDYLAITYTRELEQEGYLRAQMESRKPYWQRSLLFLPGNNPVWIEKNGNFFNPQDLYTSGYLGWADKMGDNLPLDYFP